MPSVAILALIIPIVAIVCGIATVMLAIYLGYRKRREIFTLYHQERMSALEKGVELPPLPEGLLTDGAAPYHPRRHLLKGLAWLFAGIGVGLGLWATTDYTWALFSLIPVGIGLAHLIYYFVEGRHEAVTGAHDNPAPVSA